MYLTRGERERLHVSTYFAPYLREWVADKRCTLTQKQKGRLKQAATIIDNTLAEFIESLEPDFVIPLIRDIKNQYLALQPTRATTRKEEVRIDRDAFYEIVDRAMVFSCRKQKDGTPCEFYQGRFKDCPLYRAFTTTASPVFDPDRKKDCPYRVDI